jgi:hypothetical protein
MPHYRVFFIDRTCRISRPPEVIECADDQEATGKARQFIDGLDIDVWQENRVIATYPHN